MDGNGLYSLQVTALGPDPYIFQMTLALKSALASPLGLHRLDATSFYSFASAANDVFVYHSNPFKARTSVGGLVLVTEYTESVLRGYFFDLGFESPTGVITDTIPLGTFSLR